MEVGGPEFFCSKAILLACTKMEAMGWNWKGCEGCKIGLVID